MTMWFYPRGFTSHPTFPRDTTFDRAKTPFEPQNQMLVTAVVNFHPLHFDLFQKKRLHFRKEFSVLHSIHWWASNRISWLNVEKVFPKTIFFDKSPEHTPWFSICYCHHCGSGIAGIDEKCLAEVSALGTMSVLPQWNFSKLNSKLILVNRGFSRATIGGFTKRFHPSTLLWK